MRVKLFFDESLAGNPAQDFPPHSGLLSSLFDLQLEKAYIQWKKKT
jgi:hypothetical protein